MNKTQIQGSDIGEIKNIKEMATQKIQALLDRGRYVVDLPEVVHTYVIGAGEEIGVNVNEIKMDTKGVWPAWHLTEQIITAEMCRKNKTNRKTARMAAEDEEAGMRPSRVQSVIMEDEY